MPATMKAVVGLLLATSTVLVSHKSAGSAVPNFATQTGQPCTACHIGGYGPQLTPLGRAFKIGGYTQPAAKAGSPTCRYRRWC